MYAFHDSIIFRHLEGLFLLRRNKSALYPVPLFLSIFNVKLDNPRSAIDISVAAPGKQASGERFYEIKKS